MGRKALIIRLLFFIQLFLALLPLSAQPPVYTANTYGHRLSGYFFLTTFKMWGANTVFHQMIIDGNGQPVYHCRFDGASGSDFKLQPDHSMSYYGIDTAIHIMSSDFKETAVIKCINNIYTDPHDMQVMKNGHYLLIGYEFLYRDLSDYRLFFGKKTPGGHHTRIKSGVIQELDRNGKAVFEWHAKDHFSIDDADEAFLTDTNHLDWTHFNSVEEDRDGNFLVSVRNFNEVTKINRSTGAIMWRMGGRRNQIKFIGDPVPFLAQHDVRRAANGNITIYDNGYGREKNHFARGLEYKVDEQNRTATLVWSYEHTPGIICERTGSLQKLADGSALLNYGQVKNMNLMLELIDSNRDKLFDLRFEDTLGTYRAFYYPSLPFSLHRPVIKPRAGHGTLTLDAGAHEQYRWSTGDTTRTIRVSRPGNYFVEVPRGKGYLRSEVYHVSAANLKRTEQR